MICSDFDCDRNYMNSYSLYMSLNLFDQDRIFWNNWLKEVYKIGVIRSRNPSFLICWRAFLRGLKVCYGLSYVTLELEKLSLCT